MKRTVKKLKLNKESIRLLDLDQTREAVGGLSTDLTCQSFTCGPSWTCPTGPSRCGRSCVC
jgi:hypothetical protein